MKWTNEEIFKWRGSYSNILVINNRVEDSLRILYKKEKSGAYTNFGVQIARNEKASDHLQFLKAKLRDFKNTILLNSRDQTPEDLQFRSKSHI
jgi:hypothetical protein